MPQPWIGHVDKAQDPVAACCAGSAESPLGVDILATRARRTRRWPLLISLVVLAGYAALGIVAYWPVFPGDPHRIYTTANQDPAQTAWFFGWMAHAITTGHNPLHSAVLNAPTGVNVAQAAFVPLLGFLAMPMTLTAGPVASANLFMVAAMPLSAASLYAVLRHWKVWTPAAALGGLIYGFSPYMIDQGAWHLNLVFAPLPPLILAVLVSILTRPSRPVRRGIVLGALAAAQYFISSELLAITAVICAVGLIFVTAYVAHRDRQILRANGRPAVLGLGVAAGTAACVVAYPVWYQFLGPNHYNGTPWSPNNPWYADALDLIAPTPRQALRPALRGLGARLSALSGAEDGAYIGIAVLALLAVLVWQCRRSERVRLAAGLGAISAVLSLGRYLAVDGHHSVMPLPFDILTRVPGLRGILAIRFSFVTGTCVALSLALAIDELHKREAGRQAGSRSWNPPTHLVLSGTRALALTGVVVALSWIPRWPYPSQAIEAVPAAVLRALPTGDPLVVTYPYLIAPEARPMLWQAEARFSIRLFGCYCLQPDSHRRATFVPPLVKPPALQEYLVGEELRPGSHSYYRHPPPVDQVVSDTRLFLAQNHVVAVIVDVAARNGDAVAALFAAALGPPAVVSQPFETWSEARPAPASIRSNL